MKLYVGSPVWGHPDWVGKIYPYKAEPKDYLYHYSRAFNTVELNPTFYDTTDSQINFWAKSVPKEFKFLPKFPQIITHEKQFFNVKEDVKKFYRMLRPMRNNIGACFIQIPPQWNFKYEADLELFLQEEQPYKLMVEFRNSWLRVEPVVTRMLRVMKDNKVGIVFPDNLETAETITNLRMTSKFSFVRFIAYSDGDTDYDRIDDWTLQLSRWREKEVEEVYFIIHEDKDSFDVLKYAIQRFTEKSGCEVKPFRYHDEPELKIEKIEQKGLFD